MNLLILAAVILLILGLFNPRASLFWYHNERTTALSSFIYGGFLVFFICLVVLTHREIAMGTAVDSPPAVLDSVKMDTGTQVPAIAVEDPAKTAKMRVLRKLKARAERDWPNNYSTQEYWINQELEDYKYMLTIADDPIKRQAERDWPYDYSTQRYWYNEQIEARERLNR